MDDDCGEREAFLADLHVGVLSVAAGEAQPPVTAPVWYTYDPGGLVSIITAKESVKARLLRAEGQASLCVQTETPPYAYVSVEGRVVEVEDVDPDERLAQARRYLGREGGDQYIAANRDVDNLTIRIAPERWRTVDYGKVWGRPRPPEQVSAPPHRTIDVNDAPTANEDLLRRTSPPRKCNGGAAQTVRERVYGSRTGRLEPGCWTGAGLGMTGRCQVPKMQAAGGSRSSISVWRCSNPALVSRAASSLAAAADVAEVAPGQRGNGATGQRGNGAAIPGRCARRAARAGRFRVAGRLGRATCRPC